ncbi:MAG: methyltransferase domain-containing protein [Nitrospirae bacterium]|nr:MAG: methyltransferase domain-containing protein [Nitrospirota bacterium]
MDEQELKKRLQAAFNAVANGYDNPALRFFPESAKHLPQFLKLKGDEHVLDIATGTGHAAIALAAALPKGRVTGIDFSEGMLSRAKAKIDENGIRNISLHSMDMQSLDFPDSAFDAAVFSFSIFFVEDMELQLRHVAEKVKLGGKVLATSFYSGTFSPQVDIFFERVKKYGVDVPSVWRRLSTTEECSTLFEKAGLSNIRVATKDIGYYLADAGQWWDIVWNAGLRRFVSGLSPEDLEKFKKEHLQEVAGLSTDKGIWLEVKVLYAIGTKSRT